MRTVLLRLPAAVVLSFTLLAVAPPGAARPRAPTTAPSRGADLRLALLEPAYEKLPFGGDLEAALDWARGRLEAAYAPRLKAALDDAERMRLRKALADEQARLRDAHVAFEDGRSGFEASLVASEFVAGVGESLLSFKDGEVTHYLFFTAGKLYKVARAYKPSDAFDTRVTAWSRDFGQPQRTDATQGPDARPATAVWTGQKRRLRLVDQRRLFHGDLAVVEDVRLTAEAEARRGGKTPGTTRQTDPELDALLDDGWGED